MNDRSAVVVPEMNYSQLIAYLNSIKVGEMDSIQAKLDEAKDACLDLDQVVLAEQLDEASQALAAADFKTYRKRVASVISRLGHLR